MNVAYPSPNMVFQSKIGLYGILTQRYNSPWRLNDALKEKDCIFGLVVILTNGAMMRHEVVDMIMVGRLCPTAIASLSGIGHMDVCDSEHLEETYLPVLNRWCHRRLVKYRRSLNISILFG